MHDGEPEPVRRKNVREKRISRHERLGWRTAERTAYAFKYLSRPIFWNFLPALPSDKNAEYVLMNPYCIKDALRLRRRAVRNYTERIPFVPQRLEHRNDRWHWLQKLTRVDAYDRIIPALQPEIAPRIKIGRRSSFKERKVPLDVLFRSFILDPEVPRECIPHEPWKPPIIHIGRAPRNERVINVEKNKFWMLHER